MPLSEFIAYGLYKLEILANYLKPVGLSRAGSASGFSTNPRYHYVMGLLMKSGTLVDHCLIFHYTHILIFFKTDFINHLGASRLKLQTKTLISSSENL